MPSMSRDMNGYRDFEQGHLRTSSYANGYNPGRREDYRGAYGITRANGIEDLDQSSFEMGVRDGNFLKFEVDHLATYTNKSGITPPEDGVVKLKQMENSTGIWTMRCLLIVERGYIVIIDKANGEELEHFPLTNLIEPTAVVKNDRRETYNNLVMFTVLDDPRRSNGLSDMHIFQSVNTPAQDIIDEILAAKGEGFSRRGHIEYIPPPPAGPAPEPFVGRFAKYRATTGPQDEPIEARLQGTRPGDIRFKEAPIFRDGRLPAGAVRRVDNRASYIYKDNMDTGQNEALDRDVQLLNNCFDDIERFVSRLQKAAEAYTELERRRLSRGKKKQKSAGDGILMGRARPPPAVDFIDIFQKFKFAINLLAKLKAHIHDPNAPELVHFLFTPLSLIYEASHDPVLGGRDLSSEAVAPLLIYDAKQLLINCLTSKELELWQRLGKSWTVLKEDWNGHVPPYNPRFYNGWQPSPQLDQITQPDYFREDSQELRTAERMQPPLFHSSEPTYRTENNMYAHNIQRQNDRPMERHNDLGRREDIPVVDPQIRDEYSRALRRDNYRPPSPPPIRPVVAAPYQENKPYAREHIPPAPKSRAEENMAFAADLKRVNANIYEAVHERLGKNQKELTIEKGDILEVLDKSRNWWKLKNYQGETGYAPYTILKPYDYENNAVGRPLFDDYNKVRPASYQGGQGEGKFTKDLKNELVNFNADGKIILNSSSGYGRSLPVLGSQPVLSPQSQHQEQLPKSSGIFNQQLKSSNRNQEQLSPGHRSREGLKGPHSNASINENSTPEDVEEFLEANRFSNRLIGLLTGYSGADMLNLERQELEFLLGCDEGRRLDSLLTTQKSNARYHIREKPGLSKNLEKQKKRKNTNHDNGIGSKPNIMPNNSPYSPPGSEASTDG